MTQERVDDTLFVFDLGGVLLDNVDFTPEWLDELKVDRKDFMSIYMKYVFPIMDGSIENDVLFRQIERSFGVRIEGDPFYTHFHPVLNEEVFSVIQRLRKEGFRVVAGTNNCTSHWKYIQEKGWDKLFDAVYPSQIIGLTKPHAAYYSYILEHEGYSASSSIMIDDYEENILGAERVGMKGFLLPPSFDRSRLYEELRIMVR